ncbi:MAG TPA: transferrin receptor-like dimerization domain-containing protein, partial [Rhizomicrobium sp.]
DAVARYYGEVKKLAGDKHEAADTQAKMLADRAFQLTADPTKTSGAPVMLKPVPKFELAPLENAIARLKKSAQVYDSAVAKNAAKLPQQGKARLWGLMQGIDQTLAPEKVGLAGGRGWYKNLVYAPGRFTGYGAKTLPGVREAIEDERWDDANQYAKLTADALSAYSARLDQAMAVLNGK